MCEILMNFLVRLICLSFCTKYMYSCVAEVLGLYILSKMRTVQTPEKCLFFLCPNEDDS